MLLIEYTPFKIVSDELTKFLLDHNLENILDDLFNSRNGKNYFDLSITNKGKISYLKGDRIPENKNLLFDDEYREDKAYHTKIGKLLSDKVTQKDIQKISALLSNRALEETKLFLSDEICKYYHENNYAEGRGQLNNSCMKYDNCQEYIKLYENFGNDIVQILVLLNENNEVMGRALFWHDVNYKDTTIKYMDRVYSINDNISHIFYEYAKNNNIKYFDDDTYNNKMSIDVNISEDIPLPYFDTFKYFDDFSKLNTCDGTYNLENTEGASLHSLNENINTCNECGSDFDCENEGGYSEYCDDYLCDNCAYFVNGECYPESQVIQVNFEYYHIEDENIVYSEYNSEHYHIDDVCYSEHHQDYFLIDDVINIEDDYYLLDDDEIIEIDSEWYLKENCIEINGKYYLEDDKNIIYNDDTSKYELINNTNEDQLKELSPDNTKSEYLEIFTNKGEIKKVSGEYFTYTREGQTIAELFIHKSIDNDKYHVVSEKITGSIVSSGYYKTKYEAKKNAINRLNNKTIIEIKDAINRTLESTSKILEKV